MADLVTFGESMLRYSPPDYGRLETADMLEVSVAGAESNIAIAADRAGADALWMSKLPTNPLGRRVTNFLHELGLATDVVWAEEGRQGTYYVEPGPEPRGTAVLYDRADAAVTTATPDELPVDRVTDARMFVTTGITPALSATLVDTTAELLSTARTAGTRTVFDLNYRSKLWSPEQARETVRRLLPDVDIAFVGEATADRVFDVSGDPEAVARELAGEWDLELVVLTRGSWGSVAVADGTYFEQRAIETETIDPIGTGDAFVGGMLARLLEGAEPPNALAFGTAMAALKRTIPGDVAVVTREEVERVLATGTGGIQR